MMIRKLLMVSIPVFFFSFPVSGKCEEKELTRWQNEKVDILSRKMDKSLIQSGVALNDKKLVSYIKSVADRVNLDSETDFDVMVVRDHDVNAWVSSRPVIHITTAMLTLLENEAQLAFVISHEISHFYRNHAAVGFFQRLETVSSGITPIYRVKAIFKNNVLSRGYEIEADKESVQSFLSAGYHPDEARNFLELLKYIEFAEQEEQDSLGFLNDTHPGASKRLEIFENEIEEYEGVLGKNVKRDVYESHVKYLWDDEISRSILLRDEARLRIYFNQGHASERFGKRIFYYIGEAFRLGGSDEERKKILAYYKTAQMHLPKFARVYWALARLYWRSGMLDYAKAYYAEYLKYVKPPESDYLGQALGYIQGNEHIPTVTNEASCEWKSYTLEESNIRIKFPCNWYSEKTSKNTVKATRDGFDLNRILFYSILDEVYLSPINEVVSLVEPKVDGKLLVQAGDDKIDLLEMSRASVFKSSDYYPRPGGTGYLDIDGKRWGWYEYTWKDGAGLEYTARRYETLIGSRIVGISFNAPAEYYYAHSMDDFKKILSTISISGHEN